MRPSFPIARKAVPRIAPPREGVNARPEVPLEITLVFQPRALPHHSRPRERRWEREARGLTSCASRAGGPCHWREVPGVPQSPSELSSWVQASDAAAGSKGRTAGRSLESRSATRRLASHEGRDRGLVRRRVAEWSRAFRTASDRVGGAAPGSGKGRHVDLSFPPPHEQRQKREP
jgi:hypothetical protein